MSILFNNSYAEGSAEKRTLNKHAVQLLNKRKASNKAVEDFVLAANAGQTPADAYRAFDATTKIETVPRGHLALLTRVMQNTRPVSIGKQVYEYRQSSRVGNAQVSMDGQKDITIDHASYGYEGTVVPIFDEGYGVTWREHEGNMSEAFDTLVDASREAERTLMEKINDYMLDGDASVTLKGRAWLGLRNDPSVASATLLINIVTETSNKAIRDELVRLVKIMTKDNQVSGDLTLTVSTDIHYRLTEPYDSANANGKTLKDHILEIPGVGEIVEDYAFEGNQLAMLYLDVTSGFHAVVGMPISSYSLMREMHNDDFNFMKWAAVGFVAKQSKSGKKTALYAAL